MLMYVCVHCVFICGCGRTVKSSVSHLVRGALGDTKATRSVCERLLEREISSLSLWEEVPRKIEPMDGDGAKCVYVHHRVEVCVCVCVRMSVFIQRGKRQRRSGGGSNNITGIQIYNSNSTHVPTVTIVWH